MDSLSECFRWSHCISFSDFFQIICSPWAVRPNGLPFGPRSDSVVLVLIWRPNFAQGSPWGPPWGHLWGLGPHMPPYGALTRPMGPPTVPTVPRGPRGPVPRGPVLTCRGPVPRDRSLGSRSLPGARSLGALGAWPYGTGLRPCPMGLALRPGPMGLALGPALWAWP